MPVVIGGFSPGDKVPGFYGQVQYGVNGQSSAGLPIVLLLVGLMTSAGNLAPDTELRQVFQPTDVDTAAGIGGELANMGYDALTAQPNIPIFLASAALPGGAVQATATITIGGAPTGAGTIGVRIGGFSVFNNVAIGEPTTLTATNLAAQINGANNGRLPVVATAVSSTVVLKFVNPSIRGNQQIVYLVTSQSGVNIAPAGTTLNITGVAWATGVVKALNTYGVPSVGNGFYYRATAVSGTGTTGASEPIWPTTIGTTVVDNSGANQITWTCWGRIVTGGQGVTLGGGTGLETYTNLINTLASKGYGRIALACNDPTSIAAWKTKVDGDAGALVGYLEHVVIGSPADAVATATALGQTTCNDQRFEVLFNQNQEMHPSRQAAQVAANRAFQEVSDPNFNYDYYPLTGMAPQMQAADLPLHSQQVAMLNAGVTPLTTVNGVVQIVRAITTKCLTNSQPDYSTLDVGDAVVPDFVLMFMKGVWSTFQSNNPRVRGPLVSGERKPRSGVAYPELWNGKVQGNLNRMGSGDIPGTCPPILDPVHTALMPPVTDLDPSEVGRLMTAAPVVVMANLHQLGLLVQQANASIAA